jgi:hypothetical protein
MQALGRRCCWRLHVMLHVLLLLRAVLGNAE